MKILDAIPIKRTKNEHNKRIKYALIWTLIIIKPGIIGPKLYIKKQIIHSFFEKFLISFGVNIFKYFI